MERNIIVESPVLKAFKIEYSNTDLYMIANLPVWSDHPDNLTWYRQVADNRKPAKYLMAHRISVPDDLEQKSTDELWQIHEQATEDLLELQHQIINETTHLKDHSRRSPSLLDLNVVLVNRMLTSCTFCQWECEVDRSGIDLDPDNKTGACQLGEESRVGSFFHHRGEELIYRGHNGSGTIFFTSCNMRCQFCQNGNISQDKYNGSTTSPEELAAMAWLLRMEGCHNINYVGGDPTIHLHTIIRSIPLLKRKGPSLEMIKKIQRVKSDHFVRYAVDESNGLYEEEFNVPLLWNANFFMSEETMKILRTVIDIWLPDFKFGLDKKCATRLSRTPWYWDTITRNLKTIYDWNEDFTIRHLVMPNHVDCCTKPILEWIADNVPGTQVNIMDQYHPDSFTNPITEKYNPRYEDISRRLNQEEFDMALTTARNLGLDFKSISFS